MQLQQQHMAAAADADVEAETESGAEAEAEAEADAVATPPVSACGCGLANRLVSLPGSQLWSGARMLVGPDCNTNNSVNCFYTHAHTHTHPYMWLLDAQRKFCRMPQKVCYVF